MYTSFKCNSTCVINVMQEIKFTISTKSLFKVLGFILFLYIVYLIWNILLLFFIAFILASLIDPFAKWLQKRKIPRALAVIIIYIALFGLLALTITVLSPVIFQDLPQFTSKVTQFVNNIQKNTSFQHFWDVLGNIQQTLGLSSVNGSSVVNSSSFNSTISGVYATLSNIFGGIFSLVLVLVITFYMVSQEDPLKKILRNIIPDEYVPYLAQLFKKIREKLGAWLRGQLLLSLIVGILVFLGLTLLGVKYAGVLGLLAAIMEFVPYLGPIFSAVPALLISFSDGGMVQMVIVLAMYVVLQQLENHLIVPKVMQKAVGLNPIISIMALLIGAQLGGIVGVLIAIPVATSLGVFLEDLFDKKQ